MAETLTVTVDDGGTYTINVHGVALFTNEGLTTPAVFPMSVSATTTWYAADPTRVGRRDNIELTVTAPNGSQVPVRTFNSLPATVSLTEGEINFSAPGTNGSSSAAQAPMVWLPLAVNQSHGNSLGADLMISPLLDDPDFIGPSPTCTSDLIKVAAGEFVTGTDRPMGVYLLVQGVPDGKVFRVPAGNCILTVWKVDGSQRIQVRNLEQVDITNNNWDNPSTLDTWEDPGFAPIGSDLSLDTSGVPGVKSTAGGSFMAQIYLAGAIVAPG